MSTIAVNDTTLHYERQGRGPAMLFVHGMCGDAEVWADQARRFADRFTCVRYDRRGHTRSARGEAVISHGLHADDAAALIDALDLAPCLIVGSSGGAAVAVDVALRHGHLLRGAVFSEPPLFSLDPDAAAVAMRDLGPLVDAATATGDRRRFVDEFFSLMCPGLWSTIGEDRKDRYRANADIGFIDLRSPSLAVAPADLAAVTVPALVIAGITSHPALRSVAHRLAAALPDARFVELTDCGHVTYAEQPERFAHAVSVFAAELDRRDHSLGLRRRTGVSGGRPSPQLRLDGGPGMAPAHEAVPSAVRSQDGTEIAYWTAGTGPPLVVVHGTPADHTRWRPLLPYLEPHFTVHAIDRRGRGASGDAPEYALEREYEDVAAVVDAVAAESKGPVNIYGHSHGGIVAFGAATLTANVHKLVLYEGWPVPDPEVYALPPGLDARMDALLAAGDHDGAVELLFRELENISDEDMAAFKAAPSWPGRVAAAHTIPREIRSECTARLDLELAGRITVPVLLVTGEHSFDASKPHAETVAAALPNTRTVVVDGQGHVADVLDPGAFAARIVPFLSAATSG